ncbi:MAG: PorT family protein [Cyclobacteriaceae bacterium]|jgi:hypothetical protein|nr:PorT family protein [Cyclobacteriaceae bacterium]
MERQKFEESFRKSFGDAEVPPSEKVWMNIELDLERLERGQMKKRLTFFKLLAAASVVFGLALAGAGLYLLSANRTDPAGLTAQHDDIGPATDTPAARETPEQALSQRLSKGSENVNDNVRENAPGNTSVERSETSADTPTAFDRSDVRSQIAQRAPQTRQTIPGTEQVGRDSERQGVAGEHVVVPGTEHTAVSGAEHAGVPGAEQTTPDTDRAVLLAEHNAGQDAIPTFRDRPLPPLVKQKTIEPHFPKTEPDKLDLLLASIAMEERAEAERKKYEGERIWTSVGFSAGTFSNYGAGTLQSPTLMANTMNLTSVNNTLASESQASGVTYSVGVNVGGRIAPRWVLQGGINYITQNASFMSDAVVTEDYQNFTAAYSAEITKMTDAAARVVPTAPYSVSNNMEFLSIPIQAGYLLVNRAFGVQLTGGVATDLFIQNTLQPQSGNLEKVTNGSGSDSPYRTVNFSGLVGTEFSYRFSEKYRISLNPGLRYPFSSIYKSDVGLSATPVTFDVGLRFRYIFD